MNIEAVIETSYKDSLIFPGELVAVKRVLNAGETYGYGNMMAWLATAWAVNLRDEHGLSAKYAIARVSKCNPYQLPPRRKKVKK